MDKPILVGEFPAAAYESDGLPNGASTEDVVEYLYTRDFAGGFRSLLSLFIFTYWKYFLSSWAFIPDEFNGNGQLEQDVLAGLEKLKGREEHGKVNINVN